MGVLTEEKRIQQVALLVALACVLQLSESMIPHPVPGLRLGLANMVTLTALVLMGFRRALEIAVIRTVLGSLIIGTFMSPGFLLSFAAAVSSTLVMGLFHRISGVHPKIRFSIIGISIIGAFCHNLVQLVLAYLILVKHSGVLVLFPWLSAGSLATGWVVGIVAGGVCRRLENAPEREATVLAGRRLEAPGCGHFQAGESKIHRAAPEVKIAAVGAAAAAVFVFEDYRLYLLLASGLLLAAAVSRTPPGFLWSRVRQYMSLIAAAFLFPLFFNSGGHVLATIASVDVTAESLATGGHFAARIALLIATSSVLMRTTSAEDMTRGLVRLLSPLSRFGIADGRWARVLALSWGAVPEGWVAVRENLGRAGLGRAGRLKDLLPLLSVLIAGLYAQTGPVPGTGRAASRDGPGLDAGAFEGGRTAGMTDSEGANGSFFRRAVTPAGKEGR